jgi:hypothetical protein
MPMQQHGSMPQDHTRYRDQEGPEAQQRLMQQQLRLLEQARATEGR